MVKPPTENPLVGSRVRLLWARQRIDEIDTYVRAFLNFKPYDIRFESNPERTEHVAYAVVRHSPDVTLSRLIGESLYHLRASLDHAVWAFTPDDVRARPEASGIEFPIYEFESVAERERITGNRAGGAFQENGSQKISPLSRDMQDAIKEVQPYNVSRWSEPRTDHELWTLQTLARSDRHRAIVPTGALIGNGWISRVFPTVEAATIPSVLGPFDHGERVALIRTSKPSEPQEYPELQLSFDVTFGEIGPDQPIVVVLRDIHEFIERIVLPIFKVAS